MFQSKRLDILVLTLTLLVLPAIAGAEDDKWRLRIGAAWVDPDVDFTAVDSDGDRVAVSADGAIGLSLALERKFSRRLGVELGILFAEPDINIDAEFAEGSQVSVDGSVKFTAFTAGLNIHLIPNKAMDLYIGPLFVYTSYSDIHFAAQAGEHTVTADISSNDNFVLGAQIGADIPFGDGPWSLNLAARVVNSSLGFIDDQFIVSRLEFDPLLLSAGFGYRF
jgi:outer membrane protein W